MRRVFPFSAILGQDRMKNALIWNVVNPHIGGALFSGQKGTAKSTLVRALAQLLRDIRVVELPLNVTEDRLVGTIDIQAAIRSGQKCFDPGILSKADGQLLYIDEVNLLSDHIVNCLLETAASGVNRVERGHILRAFCEVCTDRQHESGGRETSSAISGSLRIVCQCRRLQR